ncbi:hypothetical protein HBB16_15855 [Pseudonocardia sp. MCCB 268]|nr:hypothetical protein [Pseudonocardia cytotoxica]
MTVEDYLAAPVALLQSLRRLDCVPVVVRADVRSSPNATRTPLAGPRACPRWPGCTTSTSRGRRFADRARASTGTGFRGRRRCRSGGPRPRRRLRRLTR